MRGTVAKRLRRMVYGDLSLKLERQYAVTSLNDKTIFNAPNSLRARYQHAKYAYHAWRRLFGHRRRLLVTK